MSISELEHQDFRMSRHVEGRPAATGNCVPRAAHIALATAFGLACLLIGVSASAQDQRFNLQQFHPQPTQSNGGLSLLGGQALRHAQYEAHVLGDYAARPLVFVDEDGERVGSLVGGVTSVNFLFAVGLFDVAELGVVVPLVAAARGDAEGVPGRLDDPAFGIGDIRIVPRLPLFNGRRYRPSGVALAVAANIWLPTGDEDVYSGGHFMAEPRLILDYRWASGVGVATNLGYLVRPARRLNNLEVTNALTYGLGMTIPVTDRVHLIPELIGSAGLVADEINREETPLEALLGMRFFPGDVVLQAGGGVGLIGGFGTPDWRVFLSVGYAKPVERDRDGDGIPDEYDDCPDEPEDYDGWQDFDGCPDPDNDDDGIPDWLDACPNDPEDFNGFEDEDGCPEGHLDYDGDGIPNELDACPYEPEDFNGFEDEDGCPEGHLDYDGDGILNADDSCPFDPEDFNGFEDEDGCPEGHLDYDGDGIPNALDACPFEPETINGFEDEDGCPDEGESSVQVTEDRIVLLEMVFFDTDSDAIDPQSYPVLNQVASVLRAHAGITRVRIEGHTDNRGDSNYNRDLSQRRAASVVRYLVERGIAPDRLESAGFGPDRPIADNGSRAGRAENRRVEFHIVP